MGRLSLLLRNTLKLTLLAGKWFRAASIRVDGVLPTLITEPRDNRYAVKGVPKTFSEVHTFTRSTTGTYEDVNGIIQTAAIDAPRFEYRGGVAKGVLIEDSATNEFVGSEAANSGWSQQQLTVATDTWVAPDGTTTGDTLTATVASQCRIEQSRSIPVTDTTYTVSTYCTSTGDGFIGLGHYSDPAASAIFDLDLGVVTSQTAGVDDTSIEEISTGIYRVSMTVTVLSTAAFNVFKVLVTDGVSAELASIGQTAKCWGMQLETGTKPTSYIPTAGAAVSRAADVLKIDGAVFASFWNADRGTLYIEQEIHFLAAFNVLLGVNDGTSNERFKFQQASGGEARLDITDGGVVVMSSTVGSSLVDVSNKEAFAYELNNSVLASGGIVGVTDVAVTIPTVDRIEIMNQLGSNISNGYYQGARYYPIRVLNASAGVLTAGDNIVTNAGEVVTDGGIPVTNT